MTLANQPCPCESSFCEHAPGPCPNAAEGDQLGKDPIMLYLGPCCRACAERMVETGGAHFIMKPIGTATQYVG